MAVPFKARKKPQEIEMLQWTNNEAQVRKFIDKDDHLRFNNEKLEIWNSENQHWCNVPMFHFIAKGLKGELYPISPEILDRSFEILDE